MKIHKRKRGTFSINTWLTFNEKSDPLIYREIEAHPEVETIYRLMRNGASAVEIQVEEEDIDMSQLAEEL